MRNQISQDVLERIRFEQSERMKLKWQQKKYRMSMVRKQKELGYRTYDTKRHLDSILDT